ncbi:hypothetical protein [Candidatus Nitrososphaera sp. FF02]|uniref:hypothetical protein n=1 Tax=Candidatus Nitrososphaera sp. FF02 TaxID=3398226 RepID=UPI0039E99018
MNKDPNSCSQCYWPLEIDAIINGETLCPGCQKTKARVEYVAAAKDEADFERRFNKAYGVTVGAGGTSTPKRGKNQKVGRKR